jgi:O-antigen ligase
LLIGLLVTPLSILYTLTRQVWLGLLLPLGLGFVLSRQQRIMILLLVLIAVTFTVMVDWSALIDADILAERAGNEATGGSRIVQYYIAVQMFLDRPFFGFGLSEWHGAMEQYRRSLYDVDWAFGHAYAQWAEGAALHNTFLRIAVELGLAGLVPLLLMFWLIFRKSLRLYRALPREGLFGRDLVLAFWQSSIAYLVCLSFVDPSNIEFLPGYFLIWAAVLVRRGELVDLQAKGVAVEDHTLAEEPAAAGGASHLAPRGFVNTT